MAQEMCNTLKRTNGRNARTLVDSDSDTKSAEGDKTRGLRCSTPQDTFVCSLGERYSFPANSMCCARIAWCSCSPSFLCVSKKCWFSAEVTEISHDWNVQMPSPWKWRLKRLGAREFRTMSESDQHEDQSKRVDMFAVKPREILRASESARQLINQYRCTLRQKITRGRETKTSGGSDSVATERVDSAWICGARCVPSSFLRCVCVCAIML